MKSTEQWSILTSRLKRLSLAAIFLISLAALLPVPVQAATPTPTPTVITQENPEQARVVFNGLSLLLYYSSSLDPVLQKDQAVAQQALADMPFANIPESLDRSTSTFSASSIALAGDLGGLFQLWDQQNELVHQYRLDEAAGLFSQISGGLPDASARLEEVRLSVEQTGAYFKIDAAESGSELRLVYKELTSKLDRLQAMLDLLKLPFTDSNGQPLYVDALLKTLKPTVLTLGIEPLIAYVGDNVSFRGSLTSEGEPLAGREVDILLNDTLFVTARTAQNGDFEGELNLPYWYQRNLKIQAAYYPQEADSGVYLGTSSQVIRLNTIFYAASLTLNTQGKAYPGRAAALNGHFDYGDALPIERSGTRVSLDDAFLTGFTASPAFSLSLDIPDAIAAGRHTLAVYVPSGGRYSSVSASYVLEVVLAPISLDLKLPRIGLTPGSFKLAGRAYSDLGPLQNAAMEVNLEDNLASMDTAGTGDFSSPLKIAPGFNLLGTQTLTIRVQPREPWNDSLIATQKLFIINWISCGLLLLVLMALAVVLPRRIGDWSRKLTAVRVPPPALPTSQPVSPVYQVSSFSLSRDDSDQTEKFPDAIFNWYRLALAQIQKMTNVAMQPQQTFREYARQNSRAAGWLGRYFLDFTFLIERLLYSRHSAGPDDIAKARQLSQTIHKKEAPHEDL